MLFNKTRQYNKQIFYKNILLKYMTRRITATETNINCVNTTDTLATITRAPLTGNASRSQYVHSDQIQRGFQSRILE